MKKVSLVIPMYYEELVAEECYNKVSEVLKGLQDYEYEIIFINDGSKDRTLEILEEIAKKDNNVKIISFSRKRHEPSESELFHCMVSSYHYENFSESQLFQTLSLYQQDNHLSILLN